MNGNDIERLYKGQTKLGERMAVVETEVKNISAVVGEVKDDIKCIDKKLVNNIVNDAKTKTKVSLGQWIAGIIIVAAVSGLVTLAIKSLAR